MTRAERKRLELFERHMREAGLAPPRRRKGRQIISTPLLTALVNPGRSLGADFRHPVRNKGRVAFDVALIAGGPPGRAAQVGLAGFQGALRGTRVASAAARAARSTPVTASLFKRALKPGAKGVRAAAASERTRQVLGAGGFPFKRAMFAPGRVKVEADERRKEAAARRRAQAQRESRRLRSQPR